jgi:transposase
MYANCAHTIARPFTWYDLRNADERIAQVRTHVDRQRATLAGLEPFSPDARWVGQVLSAMERMLRQFQEHRSRIEGELERYGEFQPGLTR